MVRPTFSGRVRSSVVVIAAAVALLGACGSSSSPKADSGASGGTTNSTSASGTKDTSSSGGSQSAALCTMFSAEEVSTLFGKEATKVDAPENPLAKEQCVYKDKDRQDDQPYWLFQARHYTQPAVFDAKHEMYKNATDLPGIGDAAFIAPDTLGTGWTIQVKMGDDVYTFDLNASNFGGAKPDVPKDAFVQLVQSKLG